MPEYKWKPIEDISEELYSFIDYDLLELTEEWERIRNDTPDNVVKKVIDEINREWAIETGKIEGLYTLSDGITKTLITHGINAKYITSESTNLGPNELTQILEDQYEVIEGLMDYVGRKKVLTLVYIRQMHEVFTRHQDTTEGVLEDGSYVQVPLLKGQWKKWVNNPEQKDKTIHEYCPPEQVQIEMERLISLHKKHNKLNVRPEVEAAFLHHRFTQIHPFQDGNGRIARALASLIFIQSNGFPFVVGQDERKDYIDSLEAADNGEIVLLQKFMTEKQKDFLYKAIKEAQSQKLQSTLSTVEGQLTNYIEGYEEKKKSIDKANDLLTLWNTGVLEIIKKYEEIMRTSGITGDSLIINSANSSKEITTNRLSPGKVDQTIGKIKMYTHIFRFPPQNTRFYIKLFVGDLSENDMQLYAELGLIKAEKLASYETSLSEDNRISDIRFRAWFQKNFYGLVDDYMSY